MRLNSLYKISQQQEDSDQVKLEGRIRKNATGSADLNSRKCLRGPQRTSSNLHFDPFFYLFPHLHFIIFPWHSPPSDHMYSAKYLPLRLVNLPVTEKVQDSKKPLEQFLRTAEDALQSDGRIDRLQMNTLRYNAHMRCCEEIAYGKLMI